MSITTRTKTQRWEADALPIGFNGLRYPEALNYLTTTKSMMDHRNPSLGLQAVKIFGGSKAASMQILQLHLSGVTRSWLRKLPKESIRSWDDLSKQFISNFRSTSKRSTSIE
jgi:hypothetical protein